MCACVNTRHMPVRSNESAIYESLQTNLNLVMSPPRDHVQLQSKQNTVQRYSFIGLISKAVSSSLYDKNVTHGVFFWCTLLWFLISVEWFMVCFYVFTLFIIHLFVHTPIVECLFIAFVFVMSLFAPTLLFCGRVLFRLAVNLIYLHLVLLNNAFCNAVRIY